MQYFFEISGWVFGLVSFVVAIIQTIGKNKYKKIVGNLRTGDDSTVQQAKAGKNSTITQTGGTYNEK